MVPQTPNHESVCKFPLTLVWPIALPLFDEPRPKEASLRMMAGAHPDVGASAVFTLPSCFMRLQLRNRSFFQETQRRFTVTFQAMSHDRSPHILHILRQNHRAPLHQRPGTRRIQQGQAPTR